MCGHSEIISRGQRYEHHLVVLGGGRCEHCEEDREYSLSFYNLDGVTVTTWQMGHYDTVIRLMPYFRRSLLLCQNCQMGLQKGHLTVSILVQNSKRFKRAKQKGSTL